MALVTVLVITLAVGADRQECLSYPISILKPLALIVLAAKPVWWPLAVVMTVAPAVAAWAVAGWVLHDPLVARRWYLLPLQDLASFAIWLAGLFGNTITWRRRRYYLHRDGRFELVRAGPDHARANPCRRVRKESSTRRTRRSMSL